MKGSTRTQIGQAMIQTDAPRGSRQQRDSDRPAPGAGSHAPGLGSWTALHEHQVAKHTPADGNHISAQGIFTLNASGNFVHAPGKFVAVVGVKDLVVVETDDAILVTTRESSQEVGKVVKHLDEKKLTKLV